MKPRNLAVLIAMAVFMMLMAWRFGGSAAPRVLAVPKPAEVTPKGWLSRPEYERLKSYVLTHLPK